MRKKLYLRLNYRYLMSLHIISVGGSLIVPEEIDTAYLASLKDFIIERIGEGERFVLISGEEKSLESIRKQPPP